MSGDDGVTAQQVARWRIPPGKKIQLGDFDQVGREAPPLSTLVNAQVRKVTPDAGRRLVTRRQFMQAHARERARPARSGSGPVLNE